MGRTKLHIKGIVRNIPESTVADGACEEIINLRYKDEAWRPVGPKSDVGNTPNGVTKVWVHKGSDYENYIGLRGNGIVWFDKETGSVLQVIHSSDNVEDIEFIGNSASIVSKDKVLHALFVQDQYHITSNIKVPNIKIGVVENVEKWHNNAYISRVFSDMDRDKLESNDTLEMKKLKSSIKALYGECLDEAYKDGMFEGYMLVRCVLSLYDGTPYYSYPFLIQKSPITETADVEFDKSVHFKGFFLANVTGFQNTAPVDGLFSGETFLLNVRYGRLKVDIDSFTLTEAEKNIVKTIDIYCAKPISSVDIDASKFDVSAGNRIDLENTKNIGQKMFDENTPLYKIKSIPVEDAMGSYSEEIEFDVHNITSYPLFDENVSAMHSYSGGSSYVINNRLVLGDVRKYLFKGYDPALFTNTEQGSRYHVSIRVVFKDNKDSVVVSSASVFDSIPLIFNETIGYPDANAKKMTVRIQDSLDQKYYYKTFELKESSSFNYAYFVNEKTISVSAEDFERIDAPRPIEINPVFTDEDQWGGYANFARGDKYESNPNMVAVSEINNPYVYPSNLVSTIGKGRVLALSSNTVALSQGQFGHHPVFVFTNDGVWAMQQGNGDIIYNSVIPVNREVCNNSKSITQIDKAIVFTTDKGLMLMLGSDVKEISQPIEGVPEHIQDRNTTYEKAINESRLVYLKENHSDVKFKDFFKDAVIGYDYVNRELLISNKAYDYSYVYNITNGVWSKTDERYEFFVNNYPETYGVINGTMKNVSAEVGGNVQVLFHSKPIKFNTETYKAMRRVILRGLLNVSPNKYAGLYILGSYDAINWAYIGGVQNKDEFRDMVAKTVRTDCKYFKIVFAGDVSQDSYINYLEIDAREELQEKLR